jgi:hypothetical protein
VGVTRRFPRTPEQEFYEAAQKVKDSLPAASGFRSQRHGKVLSDEDKAAVDAVVRERKLQAEAGQINEAEAGSQEPGFFGLGGLFRGR